MPPLDPSKPKDFQSPHEASVGLSRRSVALLLGAPIAFWSARATLGLGAKPASAAALADDPRSFLALSKQLTGHGDLNPVTGERLLKAFSAADQAAAGKIPRLAELAPQAPGAPALIAAAKAEGLDAPAHAVITAWYTGTVGKGSSAKMVAYAEALMYRPVADAMDPPTYCQGGPGWWTAEPPPVGVSRPVERALTPPPTVGAPEPKPR